MGRLLSLLWPCTHTCTPMSAWHGMHSLTKGRAGREIAFSCIMFVTYIGQMCLVCVLTSQLLSVHCPDGAY